MFLTGGWGEGVDVVVGEGDDAVMRCLLLRLGAFRRLPPYSAEVNSGLQMI